MLSSWVLLAFALLTVSVGASPVQLSKRQGITALTPAQIEAFTPFTLFASTAYCQPDTTKTWKCGANCVANHDFIPTESGGNGASIQFWFVGYSPSEESVIVAHQGTDVQKIEADLTDLDLIRENLDSQLFPGVSSPVEVHMGFAEEQKKTASAILSAVQTTISQHNATKVTVVGHSLGCALALLDGVYLPLHIDGVTFRTIGYGCPRVGNQAFADYVDAHIDFTHINNEEDFVPIIPGKGLGFVHPSGEIHIQDNGQWVSCPGQDNPSTQCSVGDVPFVPIIPTILHRSRREHSGPYNGITMDC